MGLVFGTKTTCTFPLVSSDLPRPLLKLKRAFDRPDDWLVFHLSFFLGYYFFWKLLVGIDFGLRFLAVHTVSFDLFLSGLEWILNFEFCLLKLLIFYQKLLWNIRSRLNSSTFRVFEPVFKYLCTKLQFWSNICKYRLKNSKFRRVKHRSDIS